MFKQPLFLIALLMLGPSLYAQENYTLTGQLIDSITRLPVEFVTVTVKNNHKVALLTPTGYQKHCWIKS